MAIYFPKRNILTIAFCLYACLSAEKAAAIDIAIGTGSYSINVESFKDRRFHNVVKQELDFSCGSAALATLLRYGYGHSYTEERTLLNAMLADGNKEKIKHEGFSMLDMKNYLTKIGINSGGFRSSLDKLRHVGIPALALINNNGYMHFIVINGVNDHVVMIQDPAFGNRTLTRNEFKKIWNGIFFVILDNKQAGQKSFQYKDAWQDRKKYLAGELLNANSLADVALQSIYASNYFSF